MSTYTPPPSNPPTRKHSLHYILSPAELARDAPDVPNVASPTSSPLALPNNNHRRLSGNGTSNGKVAVASGSVANAKPRPCLANLPSDILAMIAVNIVVDEQGNASHPSRLLPLLNTCRSIYAAINFDANPVLYNRLFRATFDLGALIRRTQWMFDYKTDVPGTSKKTELFANPRSWAIEYRDRWRLRNRMRACVKYNTTNVPGVSSFDHLDTDLWALWFLWTENGEYRATFLPPPLPSSLPDLRNLEISSAPPAPPSTTPVAARSPSAAVLHRLTTADRKNFKFLQEECRFYQWILVNYKDDMLMDSLKVGYPRDTPPKALGIWLAMLSGSDLFAERTPAEVDEKIFLLRPYVFACFKYEMMYADWHHRKLPLCKPGCNDHAPISLYTAPYKRFGHAHRRAPPHFVLGAYLCYLRLLERQPGRIGIKATSSTSFQDESGTGLFSATHIMPSLYHDTEWQRNTVCQDPHTSPGLPPLTFHGRLQGFWRGRLLFFDFDAYRQMLGGNMPAVYTGTFATHAVELEIHETVIRLREEDVGGTGTLVNAGFADEETEPEQARIRSGYGHEVLTGDEVNKPDPAGYTKEILLSGGVSFAECDM